MANDPIKLVDVGALDRFKTDIENEIPDSVQYSTMPTASADWVGKIVQFTGTTDSTYTNGYFYKCVPGETAGTYEWIPVAVQSGGGGDIIDDEHVSTETTYSSSYIEELLGCVGITWEGATDEEIVNAISLADAGRFSPANNWAVGDTRKISLSAISPTSGVDETQPAQDIEMVIVHLGLYKDENNKTVNAVVQTKDRLNVKGKMNTTNTNAGSWDSCPRRTWLNGNFRNAIPSSIRSIFKQFKTVTAKEQNSSELTTSLDYFALPAEKEVFDAKTYSTDAEAAALTQWDYYKTSANRIKNVGTSGTAWFLRSPYAGDTARFCYVATDGRANYGNANTANGIAPFGCI